MLTQKPQRFLALDVFRGATVALMILVNNPGSWSNIYGPLKHAPWHGVTPTDLVFPFFLFAVGNAMAFVIPRLKQAGDNVFWKKVLKRSLLIFGIGLLLNWYPFIKYDDAGSFVGKPWETVRIFGVLQRIAVAYLFASIIVYFGGVRGGFFTSAVLLLAYWFICLAGNSADPFGREGWFGTALDKLILGENHMYKGEGYPFDPEGIASSLPPIAQVVFGYLVGDYIIKKGKSFEMLTGLFVSGFVLTLGGLFWDMFFPINKKIWTSSYVLYTTGLGTLFIATMIYMLDFRNYKAFPVRFFEVFGKNPLFIFVMSALIPKTLSLIRIPNGTNSEGKPLYLSPLSWIYKNICEPLFTDPKNASLLYAIIFITFMWLLAWWLNKKKIYIKV